MTACCQGRLEAFLKAQARDKEGKSPQLRRQCSGGWRPAPGRLCEWSLLSPLGSMYSHRTLQPARGDHSSSLQPISIHNVIFAAGMRLKQHPAPPPTLNGRGEALMGAETLGIYTTLLAGHG